MDSYDVEILPLPKVMKNYIIVGDSPVPEKI